MEFDDILSNYVIGDGKINSLRVNLNYQDRDASEVKIELIVRKPTGKKFEKCMIELQFNHVIEIGLNEDFTSDYYSDITFVKQENGFYYLSLDPYGNSGQPNENDNMVIIAKSITFKEIE